MVLMPSVYRAFGRTAKGDPRHQCKSCGGTFSIRAKTRRHKRTDRTGDILLNLVNKVPLSRICEINGVTFPQVYAKIDFIYRQCLAMGARRERSYRHACRAAVLSSPRRPTHTPLPVDPAAIRTMAK